MAAEREDVALVAELSVQLAAGGSKLAMAKRRCSQQSASSFWGDQAVEIRVARSQGW